MTDTEVGNCSKCGTPVHASFVGSYCQACGEVLPYEIEARRRQISEGHSDVVESDSGTAIPAVSGQSGSSVVNRYRDAYRVGAALVGLGNGIKIVGAILGGIILLGSLSTANNQFGGSELAGIGVFVAAVTGGLFWVCGVVVAAQGQILRATLDTAVASSHFLNDSDRADAMGLPRSVATR